MIGIVGGVGPYAGLDQAKNIFNNTIVKTDQDHLDLIILSMASSISDRTEFLMGRDPQNPAEAILEVLLKMEASGATVAGIPCNTAHAPEIFELIISGLKTNFAKLNLLNMVEETITEIQNSSPAIKRIAVLSTTGTYRFGVYSQPLEAAGFEVIVPDLAMQEKVVHPAIYDREYGIKAKTNPITERAQQDLLMVAKLLIDRGAELIIKGCTEIVLALPQSELDGIPTIDPSIVLARSLIQNFAPDKLKPIVL